MFNAILFDMDGLILDTEPINIKARVEEGNKIGLEITEEMAMATIGMSHKYVEEYFKKFFGDRFDHSYFREKRKEHLIKYMKQNGLPLKEGVVELLEFLKSKKIRTAIVTSSSRNIINEYKKYGNIFDYFELIVSGDEVKEGKPSPDVYLYAALKLGVEPSSCLVLEDSKNGVISGSKAGMTVCMIPDLIVPDEEVFSYHPIIKKTLLDVMEMLK